MHHTMRFSRSVLLLAGMLTLGVGTLQAQTDIFTSANGNWNATGNWSLGSLPTPSTPVTIIGAQISSFTYPSNAVANVNNGDSMTCSNLYVGYANSTGNNGNIATGTLNIAGGTLLVTGTNFCGSGTGNGCSTGEGGVIMQTGGVMTNLGPVYLTYGAGTGTWTVAGGTLVTMGGFTIGHFAGNGKLTISGGVMSNASTTTFGYGGYRIAGTLIVTNTGVLYLSGASTFSTGGGATDTISQSSGTLIIATNAISTGASGGYTVWTMTGGAFTNTSTIGFGNGAGTDTWTMTGGVWSNQGLITVSLKGNCTMNMQGGTLIAQSGMTIGAGTGTVNQTGGLIISGGNIIVGASSSTSTGLWTMAGGVLTNNGALYVGEGIQPGALMITNSGTWWQGNPLYIGCSASGFGAPSAPGTGAMTVANGTFLSQSNVYVSARANNSFGTLLVTNATFISTNAGTAFTIGTNGVVTVCGTQRVFQVAALTNFAGIFSNNIAQVAGGLDITTTNAGALTVTNNGLVTLVFSQNPVAPGNFWGLRWLGTNHVTALTAMHAASQLTWNDSQLSSNYRGLSGIYTDAVYTYVGFKLNALPVNGTSMFFW